MENTSTLQMQWAEICSQLAQNLRDRFVMRWLSKVIPEKIEGDEVNLTVASPCVHELIQQNYLEAIASLWKSKNADIRAVHLTLKSTLNQPEPKTNLDVSFEKHEPLTMTNKAAAFTVTPTYKDDSQENTSIDIPCYLDKTHTFDTFVVGKSNQFAFAAAKKIADEEGTPFNPLYVHAGVGLGKTHLLHAIAWRIKERHPEKNVLYLSCEQFFQRCKNDLNTKDKDSFLNFVQSVDVLLIDDIQFLLSKKWTQEVFLQTFNHLVAEQKTVILSANSLPNALQGMDEKLRARIAQGLVVDIAPADENLRLGILMGKNQEMGAAVPNDVLAFLAKSITSNVRELEGALKRIVAHSELIGNPINLATTQSVLKDILHAYERPIKAPEVQQVVADYYRISLSDLQSKRRDRAFARPRQIAMYLTKVLTPLPLPDIALCFKRDHSTVIHAVRTIEGLLKQDKQMAAQVAEIKALLKAGNYV